MSETQLTNDMSDVLRKYLPTAMAGEMLKFLNECHDLKETLSNRDKEIKSLKKEVEELKYLKAQKTDIEAKFKQFAEYERKINKMEEGLQDRLRQYELDVENLKLKAKYEAGIEAQNSVKEIVSTLFQNVSVEAKRKTK